MTDELVNKLRAVDHLSLEDCYCQSPLYAEAADRIEQLTAERDAAKAKVERLGREVNVAKYGQPDFAWSVHLAAMDELQADAARLREALTDALDAWDTHNKHGDPMQGRWVHDARAALKGESHE